jgi:hypothetical protein
MACYIVSYDLTKKGEKVYDELYDKLKSYGVWARITESTWAIVTDGSARDVRRDLKTCLSADDRLFVVKSGVSAAWSNVRCSNEWLKKYL